MNSSRIQSMLEQAMSFADEGKILHAIQVYHRVLAAEPSLDEPYIRLALLYSDQGQQKVAERLLARGLRQNPRHPDLVLMLGDVLVTQQRFEQAVECYARLSRLKLPRVHYSLALAHLRQGNLDASEREVRTALRLSPSFPRIRELLGEILLRRKQFGPALVELRNSVRRDPYSGTGHRLCGMALLGSGRIVEALEELHLAVDINPGDASAWQLCGETLIRMRRYPEARYYLERALSLDPAAADAATSLGYLRLQTGDTAGALAAFDSALRMHPGHPRALDGKLHVRILSRQS